MSGFFNNIFGTDWNLSYVFESVFLGQHKSVFLKGIRTWLSVELSLFCLLSMTLYFLCIGVWCVIVCVCVCVHAGFVYVCKQVHMQLRTMYVPGGHGGLPVIPTFKR